MVSSSLATTSVSSIALRSVLTRLGQTTQTQAKQVQAHGSGVTSSFALTKTLLGNWWKATSGASQVSLCQNHNVHSASTSTEASSSSSSSPSRRGKHERERSRNYNNNTGTRHGRVRPSREQRSNFASSSGNASLDVSGGLNEKLAALVYGFLEPLERKTRKPKGFPKTHKRCGAVAMKCGMTREWDANGVAVPLTVLWLDENHVIQVKSEEKEGFYSMQVGAGSKRHKRVNKSLIGHFRKHLGVQVPVVSRKVIEFKVTENCLLEPGTQINADHFVVGQFVDVQGTTKGKGFAGGMKRHGMKGGPASHGTTKAHRTIGSTGQCQDPGKVFKGKKMPGRMGGKTCSQQRLLVYKVDPIHNLIYIKGQVPGGKGGYVRIIDSKIAFQDVALPYPTRQERQEDVTIAFASTKSDPFTRYWQY